MSDEQAPRSKDDLVTRRDMLRKLGGFSAISSLAMLAASAFTGCGGSGYDDWYDYANYGDDDWTHDSYPNYSDSVGTGFYGNSNL